MLLTFSCDHLANLFVFFTVQVALSNDIEHCEGCLTGSCMLACLCVNIDWLMANRQQRCLVMHSFLSPWLRLFEIRATVTLLFALYLAGKSLLSFSTSVSFSHTMRWLQFLSLYFFLFRVLQSVSFFLFIRLYDNLVLNKVTEILTSRSYLIWFLYHRPWYGLFLRNSNCHFCYNLLVITCWLIRIW